MGATPVSDVYMMNRSAGHSRWTAAQTVACQAAICKTGACPEQWEGPVRDTSGLCLQLEAVAPEACTLSLPATAMPSEMSEIAEMPEGPLEESDEEFSVSSPSKSARRRMRRRRQRETLKVTAPLLPVPQSEANAQAFSGVEASSLIRATVTLGDLGFDLFSPIGTSQAAARKTMASTTLPAASRGWASRTPARGRMAPPPMPPGVHHAPVEWRSVGEEAWVCWDSLASPCRAHVGRHGTRASGAVSAHIGMDSSGRSLAVAGSSTTASTPSSECSEVSYCPLTATAQLWMPINPGLCAPASPCRTRDAGLVSTNLCAASVMPCEAAPSAHGSEGGVGAGGDASSRIPCLASQAKGGLLYVPSPESLSGNQALGGRGQSFVAPDAYESYGHGAIAFGGTGVAIQSAAAPIQTTARPATATADALQLLLVGGASWAPQQRWPHADLVAQLQAAAPEVYED